MKELSKTTQAKEYNLAEVAKFLNLDYQRIKQNGQVDQLLKTGVTSAMPVKIQAGGMDGKSITVDTTARLALGTNKRGEIAVKAVFKENTADLSRYKDITLSADQQAQLRAGKIVVATDRYTQEHLIKFDRELNRVAGMKKSRFLVPEQVGNPKQGYVRLSAEQQADLKRGRSITAELGGRTIAITLDPIERKLTTEPVKQQQKVATQEEVKRRVGPKL